MSEFGDFIRTHRVKSGFTLKLFAEKLGLSPAFWSRIETGRENPPKDEHISRCAQILEVSQDDCFIAASRIPPDLRPELGAIVRAYRLSQAQ